MSKFLDGPAEGQTISHSRAPVFLRVVRNRSDGKFDVLDQLDDEATDEEEIFAYIAKPGTFSRYHVTRSPRSKSGWYSSNDYVLFDPQPTDEVLRDNERWGEWCMSRSVEDAEPIVQAGAIERGDEDED